MKLYSTRNIKEMTGAKEAIIKGLSSDGGLFCPKFGALKAAKLNIKDLLSYDYKMIAKTVFKLILSDFSDEEMDLCINNAYSENNFGDFKDDISPITKIGDNYLLELYHGPTSAFKDVALTILPHFLTTAYKSLKNADGKPKTIHILTATSGDTGKAALSGFKDVENVRITVFYPTDGVSDIQKLQMQTSEGNNVSVYALKGDFDDCQRLVKEIYTDVNIKKICDKHNVVLSSANSINIGRLVPQIIYYIYTYVTLVNTNSINLYDKINFVVPTGNFGDILAGYMAKLMGLPIDKLICASNDNKVLTDFINTGVYNKNRELYKTISPSMDILVSSNLERLLFLLSGNNDKLITLLMSDLNANGEYKIDTDLLSKVKENFVAYYADENECREAIKTAFTKDNRLIDTHTAVAYACLEKFKKEHNTTNKCVILSTASPYKFAKSVLPCISDINTKSLDGFTCIDKLYEVSKEDVPENLSSLKNKEIRFNLSLSYDGCKQAVIDSIEGNI